MSYKEDIIKRVALEVRDLLDKYMPPFNSWHEAYAVIQEELDEFWDCVKTDQEEGMEEELIQVAATALCAVWQLRARKDMKGALPTREDKCSMLPTI